MNKKIKVLISALILSIGISNANAGVLNIMKKNPVLTGIGVGSALYMSSTMHISRDLSYHLEKVEPYFDKNPDKFNPVATYVLNALNHPANQSDYERYKRLAEVMGLGNIPGYSQQPEIPKLEGYEIQESSKNDNIIATPINDELPVQTIIYTPEGNPVDIRDYIEEYPNEVITNWDEYLVFKSNSKELSDNMIASGEVREADTAAHHIVPATHPLAQQARDILEKYEKTLGKNAFNNEINGAFLPKNNSSKQSGIIHNGKHPNNYVEKINQIIIDADNQGGLQKIIFELNRVKKILQNPPKNVSWSDIL